VAKMTKWPESEVLRRHGQWTEAGQPSLAEFLADLPFPVDEPQIRSRAAVSVVDQPCDGGVGASSANAKGDPCP
jgi:hypothetical protein